MLAERGAAAALHRRGSQRRAFLVLHGAGQPAEPGRGAGAGDRGAFRCRAIRRRVPVVNPLNLFTATILSVLRPALRRRPEPEKGRGCSGAASAPCSATWACSRRRRRPPTGSGRGCWAASTRTPLPCSPPSRWPPGSAVSARSTYRCSMRSTSPVPSPWPAWSPSRSGWPPWPVPPYAAGLYGATAGVIAHAGHSARPAAPDGAEARRDDPGAGPARGGEPACRRPGADADRTERRTELLAHDTSPASGAGRSPGCGKSACRPRLLDDLAA